MKKSSSSSSSSSHPRTSARFLRIFPRTYVQAQNCVEFSLG